MDTTKDDPPGPPRDSADEMADNRRIQWAIEETYDVLVDAESRIEGLYGEIQEAEAAYWRALEELRRDHDEATARLRGRIEGWRKVARDARRKLADLGATE
jgi:hypothetical protein